jgi:hypothetical protein
MFPGQENVTNQQAVVDVFKLAMVGAGFLGEGVLPDGKVEFLLNGRWDKETQKAYAAMYKAAGFKEPKPKNLFADT